MREKEKKLYNRKLYLLAVLSLIIIAAIVALGTISGKYRFFLKKGEGSIVLGISDKLPFSQLSADNIENLLEESVSTTKEGVAQKLTEYEVKLKDSLQKEITDLTNSQIQAVKEKICRDWGVVPTP